MRLTFNVVVFTFLLVILIVSALYVVSTKYKTRMQYSELELLESDRDLLGVEWSRLQLEQSTWATHGRIQAVATKEFKMLTPTVSDVVVIR